MVDKLKRGLRTGDLAIATALFFALSFLIFSDSALAISELKPAEPAPAEVEKGPPLPPLEGPLVGPDGGLPAPNPVIRPVPQTQTEEAPENPAVAEETVPVELMTDLSLLPEPARRMRQLIIDAATTGEPERLRALLGTGPNATQLAFGDIDGDPVDYIRSVSGDGEGQEILAILIDLLNAGFVSIDAGGPDETYVWPYFVALPLEELTPPQKVELLRLVTAGDVEQMKAYGAYNFYRIGIGPDGSWRFFMAGD